MDIPSITWFWESLLLYQNISDGEDDLFFADLSLRVKTVIGLNDTVDTQVEGN